MWSIGVIIYVALVGYPPFLEQDQRVMLDKIRRGDFEFYQEDWAHISPSAKTLISELLKVDPDSRLTASNSLNNEWIAHIDENELIKTHLKGSLDNLAKRRSSMDTFTSNVSFAD
jgi:calcium-dependent protein kinase